MALQLPSSHKNIRKRTENVGVEKQTADIILRACDKNNIKNRALHARIYYLFPGLMVTHQICKRCVRPQQKRGIDDTSRQSDADHLIAL